MSSRHMELDIAETKTTKVPTVSNGFEILEHLSRAGPNRAVAALRT